MARDCAISTHVILCSVEYRQVDDRPRPLRKRSHHSKIMAKRSIALITITLFVGAMAGTLTGELLGLILPEGVVKDFFLTGVSFNLGGLIGNDSGVIVLDMIMFTIQFGLAIKMNFTSIIGLAGAYYFLRYLR